MSHPLSKYEAGHRVRVTQQVVRQRGPMYATVEGIIIRFGQQKTGSWYAHAKDDKLWLDRLEMRKDDGEIVILNLDQFSTVERIKVPLPPVPPVNGTALKPALNAKAPPPPSPKPLAKAGVAKPATFKAGSKRR